MLAGSRGCSLTRTRTQKLTLAQLLLALLPCTSPLLDQLPGWWMQMLVCQLKAKLCQSSCSSNFQMRHLSILRSPRPKMSQGHGGCSWHRCSTARPHSPLQGLDAELLVMAQAGCLWSLAVKHRAAICTAAA